MPIRSIMIVNRMVLQDGQRRYRVVFIDRHDQRIWLIDIDDNNWPFSKSSSDIQHEVDSGVIKPVVDPYGIQPVLPEDNVSKIVQMKRYELLKPFLQDIRKLLTKRERSFLISSITSTTRQTATSLFKQFLKRGMTQEALRPDYQRCGHHIDDKCEGNRGNLKRNPKIGAKKVGAPRTISPGVGTNVNEEIRRHLHLGADLWLSSRTVTLRAAVEFVVQTYYSKKVVDPATGEEVFEVEKHLKPTERQLQYFIKTEYPEQYIRRKRHGTKHYELNERAVLGYADSSVQGPGDEFQIDASVANVPLVSQFDRRRIVGYPVIYFVVDTFSRLITGVSAGFEGPSWTGAMMVLINMVTPKVEFCERYNIRISEDQWPSFHAPKRLLADRAELMSVRLGNDIVKNLGIGIDNVTAGRPDLKALVERRFGVIKAEFGEFAPGYVKDKFKDAPRVGDFRQKATINLFEFTQILIRAVLIHNLTPISDISPPPEMVTEGLPPAPLDLWNWGIVNRSGTLDELSIEKTMINVMHRDKARVTSKGIKYRGVYYRSPTTIANEWFADARRCEWNVTIGMEPSNMEKILLLSPDLPQGFELCTLVDAPIDYKFKSFFEQEELLLSNRQNIAAANNDRQAIRIAHENAIRRTINDASEEKRLLDSGDDRSKTEKTKHIRTARAEEKASLQEQNSVLRAIGDKTDLPPSLAQLSTKTPHEQDLASRLKKSRERRKEGELS